MSQTMRNRFAREFWINRCTLNDVLIQPRIHSFQDMCTNASLRCVPDPRRKKIAVSNSITLLRLLIAREPRQLTEGGIPGCRLILDADHW